MEDHIFENSHAPYASKELKLIHFLSTELSTRSLFSASLADDNVLYSTRQAQVLFRAQECVPHFSVEPAVKNHSLRLIKEVLAPIVAPETLIKNHLNPQKPQARVLSS